MTSFVRSIAMTALVSVMVSAQQIPARQTNVAATPPMGWNSWDSFGLTVTEPQFRANATVLRQKLLPFGWNYAVVDEGWFLVNPGDRSTPEKLRFSIDSYGRYTPVPARFPSALGAARPPIDSPVSASHKMPVVIEETGFVGLGQWVHAQGLKFGIHIVRGIPRAAVERNLPVANSSFHAQDVADQSDACPWDPTNWGVRDNAAGQAWYDSLLGQYASWGVDFLKVDCISDHPYKADEIEMIRRAIDKTGRPIVLSLSPGPTSLTHAAQVGELANMWRISDDAWDVWSSQEKQFPQGVKDQFARLAAWEKYAKPGNWPDADMLPLGHLGPAPGWGEPRESHLTPDEQRTQLTLYSMARSPLILGANLTVLDASTLALLTNRDVIAIDQTAMKSAQVFHDGDLIAWQANLPGGKVALAVFNIGDKAMTVQRSFSELSSDLATRAWKVRDVWGDRDLGQQQHGVVTSLAPHACLLLMLHPVR